MKANEKRADGSRLIPAPRGWTVRAEVDGVRPEWLGSSDGWTTDPGEATVFASVADAEAARLERFAPSAWRIMRRGRPVRGYHVVEAAS